MQQIRKGYEVDVTVTFTDDLGNAASVDGAPTWVASGTAFTVLPVADGMAAVIQGTGEIIGETAILTMTADADLGAGVVTVTRSEDLQLVSGTAAEAGFTFGEPRPITT